MELAVAALQWGHCDTRISDTKKFSSTLKKFWSDAKKLLFYAIEAEAKAESKKLFNFNEFKIFVCVRCVILGLEVRSTYNTLMGTIEFW